MAESVESLITPISESQPCGEDQSYEPDYLNLESLAAGEPEQQMGDSIREARGPEWRTLRDNCEKLFERTRDLRIATFWALARLAMDGHEGFRDGIELIQRLTCDCWASVHPQLDPTDGNDPLERVNILQSLSPTTSVYRDPMMFIQRLREAPLAASPQLGKASMRDIMLARGELDAHDEQQHADNAQIGAIFADTPVDQLQAKQQTLRDIMDRIEQLDEFLSSTIAEASPDFSRLRDEVRHMETALSEFLSDRGYSEAQAGEDAGESETGEGGSDGAAGPDAGRLRGEIRTRADVIAALDRICAYYEKQEPSNPVPLMLKRAKRMVGMSFVDLLRDVSPNGLEQASVVFGTSSEESTDQEQE